MLKIKNKRFYSQGKRSLVYLGTLNRKKVIIKKLKPNIKAINTIKNEAYWLKKLEKYKFSPKLIKQRKYYVVMEFIHGEKILDFLEKANKSDSLKIISKIIDICRTLDKLNITKQEMHKPIKHILIYKNNPRFIDFERSKFSKKPKNLTQFCQFLTSKKVLLILNKKGIKINKHKLRIFLKKYKSR